MASSLRPDIICGIPTLNRYDLLLPCLQRLGKGSWVPRHIVVIDNGQKLQPAGLSDCPPFEVITPEEPLCLSASWNLIFNLPNHAPLILLLNDDLFLGQTTLQRMVGRMRRGRHDVITWQGCWSCLLVNRTVYKEIGPFDENIRPAYREDNDWARRLRVVGKRIGTFHDPETTHLGSQTLAAMTPQERAEFNQAYEQSRRYYLAKWGGEPDHEVFTVPFDGKEPPQRWHIVSQRV